MIACMSQRIEPLLRAPSIWIAVYTPSSALRFSFSESFALRRLPVPGELSVWNENTVLEDIGAHVNSMQFRG